MILTNEHGLPQSIVNAVKRDHPPVEDRYSVTDIINPPLIRHLRMKHWNEIEEDASDLLWMLLGTSMHYVLEKHSPEDAFQEEKLTMKMTVDGKEVTIVGKSDLYDNGVITDWKVTSTYAVLLGVKPEWEQQPNVYARLWEENGFPVNDLRINAILRDWQKPKALRERDYPKIPFVQTDIPLWDKKTTTDYLVERIRLHRQVPPPECTPEEKWERPTKYALMKTGRKSAVKLFDSRLEADMALDMTTKDRHSHYIEERPGVCMRCESYCNVSKFCPYYKKEGE
jgi:hypothetical protein